jgi:mono/diheme cytochrome c family protein
MRNGNAVLAACMTVMLAGPAAGAGDPVKGAKLHSDCLGCHGTELYMSPRAKVKTLAALKKETDRWNDRLNPKFSKQDIEDLVAYLDATFYKF